MFTFLEMLALVESESSFGAYVCRRPAGLHATGDLVLPHQAVGLGAPQTIIDIPKIGTRRVLLWAFGSVALTNISLPTSRLQVVSYRYPRMHSP